MDGAARERDENHPSSLPSQVCLYWVRLLIQKQSEICPSLKYLAGNLLPNAKIPSFVLF